MVAYKPGKDTRCMKEIGILKIYFIFFLVSASTVAAIETAHAKKEYTTDFNNYYGTNGSDRGTTMGSCITCHVNPDGKGGENPYGIHWKAYGRSFTAVEPLDSDGDGFSNID